MMKILFTEDVKLLLPALQGLIATRVDIVGVSILLRLLINSD